jgi:hypothetical protein
VPEPVPEPVPAVKQPEPDSISAEDRRTIEKYLEDMQRRQPVTRRVTAKKLVGAYEANEVAADARYKGGRLRVSGRVSSIGKTFLGTAYITLPSGDSWREVQCVFPDEKAYRLRRLSKGDHVVVEGTCRGLMGNVQVRGETIEH